MIHKAIQESASITPEREFIISPSRVFTYAEAYKTIKQFASVLVERGIKRCAFYTKDSAESIFGIVSAAYAGAESCILNRNCSVSEVDEIANQFKIETIFSDTPISLSRSSAVQTDAAYGQSPVNPNKFSVNEKDSTVIILTSGTTGPPKGAVYFWSDLLLQARKSNGLCASRWLLTYNPNHFAAFQIIVHAVMNMGTIIVPASQDIPDVLYAAKEHNAGYISATPTFWRMLIGYFRHNKEHGLALKQITIGGEPATAELLADIKTIFPRVPISQIFATTEFGSCFSVKDGLPGFPASYLTPGNTRVPLKIIDGELHVKSPHSMKGYWGDTTDTRNEWHGTGDLVDVVEDRVLFLGRKTEIINVGGAKVHPHKVEIAVLKTEGVAAARAYGIPNPVAGQIVAVDFTVNNGHKKEEVLENVRNTCLRELDRYHQPRRLRAVDELMLANQKIMRRPIKEEMICTEQR